MNNINKESSISSVGTEYSNESYVANKMTGGFFFSRGQNNSNDMLKKTIEGQLETVKYMIDNNLVDDFTVVDDNGDTVLHLLVRKYDENPIASAIVNLLLSSGKRGTFLNIQNKDGDTPLHIAVKEGNMVLAEKLLKAGAEKKIKNAIGQFIESENSEHENDNRNTKKELQVIDISSKVQPANSTQSLSPLPFNLDLTKKEVDLKDVLNVDMSDSLSRLSLNEGKSDSLSRLSLNEDKSDSLSTESTESTNRSESYSDSIISIESVSTSEELADSLMKAFGNRMRGGNKVILGSRKLNGGEYESKLARLVKKQGTEIHERVVKKIMEILKVDEQKAKLYKAYLYNTIKDTKSELSNLDKAFEMEKLANKKFLESITKSDLDKLQKKIEKNRIEKTKKSDTISEGLKLSSTSNSDKTSSVSISEGLKLSSTSNSDKTSSATISEGVLTSNSNKTKTSSVSIHIENSLSSTSEDSFVNTSDF
tara:strand:- start:2422 stop:3861 length:1440 start_codon:yes stop_codon:yes gene_type:complete